MNIKRKDRDIMQFTFSDKVSGLKPSAIREIFKSLTNPNVISFAAGNPNAKSFPVEELHVLADEIFEKEAGVALQYGITEGYTPLRRQVEARMKEKFGIGRDFDETIIVTGGQQGIDLTCKVLCNEGDVVICENPSFIGALNAFRSTGAKLVGVDVEDDGISVEGLEKALSENKNAKMIYLIPTFQNPSGITMSLEKRRAVLALAKKYGVPILEDNPYGELRFVGEDVPTIKSMDDEGIVIYCSSFSKILSSGMRIGFLCGHRDFISKVVVIKQTNDVHTNLFFQMLCSKYIERYDLDAHIAEIRKLYREKSSLMLSEMDKKFPKSVKFTRPEGGLFLWVTLPDGTDADAFIKDTVAHEVAVVPGATFLPDESGKSLSFRMNYSTPTDEQIVKGVGIIADVLRNHIKE